MVVPVARVHLKVAHAALPALLPTLPKWKMLPVLQTTPCVAAILQAKPLAKPGRADADERWDARKTKPVCTENKLASSSYPRKNTTSPPPKPGRADSVERWDAHKKAASPSLSSSSSSATSSPASSSKWLISRALSSEERWDVHKKRRQQQADQQFDDGENSSNGSNDIDDTEEIVWKPRAMYTGPGFIVAAPESSMLSMPTAFLVPVA